MCMSGRCATWKAGLHGPRFDNLEKLAEVLEPGSQALFDFGEESQDG